eukprot:3905783-Amphidinium_carterae.3
MLKQTRHDGAALSCQTVLSVFHFTVTSCPSCPSNLKIMFLLADYSFAEFCPCVILSGQGVAIRATSECKVFTTTCWPYSGVGARASADTISSMRVPEDDADVVRSSHLG